MPLPCRQSLNNTLRFLSTARRCDCRRIYRAEGCRVIRSVPVEWRLGRDNCSTTVPRLFFLSFFFCRSELQADVRTTSIRWAQFYQKLGLFENNLLFFVPNEGERFVERVGDCDVCSCQQQSLRIAFCPKGTIGLVRLSRHSYSSQANITRN